MPKRIRIIPALSDLCRAAALILIAAFSGCSVYMAATSPEQPQTEVLIPGSLRADVEKELGKPINYARNASGASAVYQYFGPDDISYGRAATYALADILTLGVAEAFTTPVESLQNDKHTVEVTYDRLGRVRSSFHRSMRAPLEKPERILGIEKRPETVAVNQ